MRYITSYLTEYIWGSISKMCEILHIHYSAEAKIFHLDPSRILDYPVNQHGQPRFSPSPSETNNI